MAITLIVIALIIHHHLVKAEKSKELISIIYPSYPEINLGGEEFIWITKPNFTLQILNPNKISLTRKLNLVGTMNPCKQDKRIKIKYNNRVFDWNANIDDKNFFAQNILLLENSITEISLYFDDIETCKVKGDVRNLLFNLAEIRLDPIE